MERTEPVRCSRQLAPPMRHPQTLFQPLPQPQPQTKGPWPKARVLQRRGSPLRPPPGPSQAHADS